MLNQDQEEFVQEAAQAVTSWVDNASEEEKRKLPLIPLGKVDFNSFPIAYQREVFGKDIQKDVKVRVGRSSPRGRQGPPDRDASDGSPQVLVGLEYDRERGFIRASEEVITSLIRHEIVHVFDPKLAVLGVKDGGGANWKSSQSFNATRGNFRDKSGEIGYSQLPWEQDAGMYQRAVSRVNRMAQDPRGPQKLTGDVAAVDDWEKDWKTRPDQWRRYLNTLYQVAKQKGLAN